MTMRTQDVVLVAALVIVAFAVVRELRGRRG